VLAARCTGTIDLPQLGLRVDRTELRDLPSASHFSGSMGLMVAVLPSSGGPMLAYDYPLLGVFWTLAMFSFFVLALASVVWALFDNFRRRDHGGWVKAGWFIFILFFPILGTFVYLVATTRPDELARQTP
jgi:hypothetical protein